MCNSQKSFEGVNSGSRDMGFTHTLAQLINCCDTQISTIPEFLYSYFQQRNAEILESHLATRDYQYWLNAFVQMEFHQYKAHDLAVEGLHLDAVSGQWSAADIASKYVQMVFKYNVLLKQFDF